MEGIVFAIAAAFLWGLDAVLIRKGAESVEIIFGTLVYQLTGVALIVPLVVAFGPGGYLQAGFKPVLMFLITGFSGVFLGRVLYNTSIREIGASRATPIAGTAPILSVIFAIFFASEPFQLKVAVGVAMIFCGVYLISSSRISLA